MTVLLESDCNHHIYYIFLLKDTMYIPVNQILVMKDIRGVTGSAISQSSDAYGDIPLVLPIALALSIVLALSKGMSIPIT